MAQYADCDTQRYKDATPPQSDQSAYYPEHTRSSYSLLPVTSTHNPSTRCALRRSPRFSLLSSPCFPVGHVSDVYPNKHSNFLWQLLRMLRLLLLKER